MKLLKVLLFIVLGTAALLAVIQLVPYGRNHTNPAVTGEPAWDSPATRDLVKHACFDCHSNETVWPWYSNIAPVSWLVQRDVDEGREKLNFSEWDKGEAREEADEAVEVVKEGEMPPFQYLINHPEARLSADELGQLITGLQLSLGGE